MCCVSSVGRFLRSLCCSANLEPACNGGRGRHPRRTGPCLCMLHETYYPAWCPPPNLWPFTLHHPCKKEHPPRPGPSVLAAALPAYQKPAWRNNGHSIHTKTWNVSECSRLGPSPLSEHALCPLVPLRETHRGKGSVVSAKC